MERAVPRGFRDVIFDEAELREQVGHIFEGVCAQAGYRLIETPAIEQAALFDASLADGVTSGDTATDGFRFVDRDGNLLALKSDATPPIARLIATRLSNPDEVTRLRYLTTVFRERESLRAQPRAITQAGIELIGVAGKRADAEVLTTAIAALEAVGLASFSVHVGSVVPYLSCIEAIDRSALLVDRDDDDDALEPIELQAALIEAARRSDLVEIKALCRRYLSNSYLARALEELPLLRGPVAQTLQAARTLLEPLNLADAQLALSLIEESCALVKETGGANRLVVDFSVMPAIDYYTGMVFEIYGDGVGRALGSGGRYDGLVRSGERALPAAGFGCDIDAVVEVLEAAASADEPGDAAESAQGSASAGKQRLRIAIPKGSLYGDSLGLLEAVGLDIDELRDPKRVLRIETEQASYIIAKPTDVPIYVAQGVVDCGFAGKDSLMEADYDLPELVDLDFGACGFVVARPQALSFTLEECALEKGVVRVATKYPRVTQRYMDGRGIPCEIVKLNGNIELAPLIGLADVIVDITATGTTLRENALEVEAEVAPSTARFVANPQTLRRNEQVIDLARALMGVVDKGEASCV